MGPSDCDRCSCDRKLSQHHRCVLLNIPRAQVFVTGLSLETMPQTLGEYCQTVGEAPGLGRQTPHGSREGLGDGSLRVSVSCEGSSKHTRRLLGII